MKKLLFIGAFGLLMAVMAHGSETGHEDEIGLFEGAFACSVEEQESLFLNGCFVNCSTNCAYRFNNCINVRCAVVNQHQGRCYEGCEDSYGLCIQICDLQCPY